MINRKLKLNFCDWNNGFNKSENFIMDILKKYFMDIEFSDNPDFLFYSCFGREHYKYKNCVKIFWTGEAITPNFNECDYGIGFDLLQFEDRYFRRPLALFENINERAIIGDNAALNRKFCNFVYSNEGGGEGAAIRCHFAKELMKYKKIDCPGHVLNNMKDAISSREGDFRKGKIEFIKDYKFTIAFENTMFNGYTTEKLVEPFCAYSLPIYWGNPYVIRDFNTKSFINCNEYNNDFNKIIERIIEIDNDDSLYLEMLHENPFSKEMEYYGEDYLEKYILDIIMKGNKPYNKDPHNYLDLNTLIVNKHETKLYRLLHNIRL